MTNETKEPTIGKSASGNYENFDDWFLEIENYGTRSERFYGLLEHYKIEDNLGLTANLIIWLKAAFESGAGTLKRLPERNEK